MIIKLAIIIIDNGILKLAIIINTQLLLSLINPLSYGPLVMVSGYGDSLETSSSLVQMAHQSPLQSALCLWVCKSNDTLYHCILYISDIVRRQSQSHILKMGMEMLMIGMTWKPSVTHMSLAVMLFEETFVCQETIMAPFDCCQIPVPERWTRQPSGRTAFGERSLAPLAKRTKVPGASSSMESVKMKLHSWFQVKIP